jgi:Fe-S cluster assembly ATP-binding protein
MIQNPKKDSLLQVDALSVFNKSRTLLDNVSFSLRDKEIYSILGPNGAGKSSLAYCIMGCLGYEVSRGSIFFQGEDITSLPVWQRARKGIRIVWQEPARFEGISIRDYLLAGTDTKEIEIAGSALKKVYLNPDYYLNRMLDRTLSGGERKRIELAAVFTGSPKLVVLDEPDAGLDLLTLQNVENLVRELVDRGSAIILITHSADIANIAENSILLGEGRIMKRGKSKDIVDFFRNECLQCPKFR